MKNLIGVLALLTKHLSVDLCLRFKFCGCAGEHGCSCEDFREASINRYLVSFVFILLLLYVLDSLIVSG